MKRRSITFAAMLSVAGCGRFNFDPTGSDPGGGGANVDGNGSSGGGSDSSIADDNGSAGVSVIGETQFDSVQNESGNSVYLSRFYLNTSGTFVKLVGWIGGSASPKDYRYVIYSESASGVPGDLALMTPVKSIIGGLNTVSIDVTPPVTLAPGPYWIGVHFASPMQLGYTTGAGSTVSGNDTFADGPNTTFSMSSAPATQQVSVYAEYTIP